MAAPITNLFDTFGVYGWEGIQHQVLSALIARIPILFVGDHGAFKTEGAQFLSQLRLGTKSKFQSYDTSALTYEDLLGFPDPAVFHASDNGDQKTMKHIHTAQCVWGQDAVNFDEINLASESITSKIHELIRVGRVMGKDTGVKLRFASLNPPAEYGTPFLNPALASRFVTVIVPSIWSMSDSARKAIIGLKRDAGVRVDLERAKQIRRAIRRAEKIVEEELFSTEQLDSVASFIDKVLKEVGPAASSKSFVTAKLSARQLRNVRRLLLSSEAFKIVSSHDGFPVVPTTNSTAKIICSVIPELFGVIRSRADAQQFESRIVALLQRNSIGGDGSSPTQKSTILSKVVSNTKDGPGWLLAVENESESCQDVKEIVEAIQWLSNNSGPCSKDEQKVLLKTLKERAIELTYSSAMDVPISIEKMLKVRAQFDKDAVVKPKKFAPTKQEDYKARLLEVLDEA